MSKLPAFERPPLEEVSLAVAFQPLSMRVVDIGLVWADAFRSSFPRVEEQSRVEMQIERFDGPSEPSVSMQFLASPPQPRVWFLNEEQTELVQLQNNWFARNWRRMERGPYPHYPSLRGPFDTDLRRFLAYAETHKWGEFHPLQVEFTYFNHIVLGDGGPTSLNEILTALNPDDPVSNLGSQEGSAYRAQYVLSHDEAPIGRVYVSSEAANRRSDGHPIQVLTLTARGRPVAPGVEGVLQFLDLVHVELVRAFELLTTPAMHEAWGKTDDR